VKSDHKTEPQINTELADLRRQLTAANRRIAELEATKDVHRPAVNLETWQQLSLIIDTLSSLLAYIDAEQHYLYVNRLYADWYGLSREEIIGKHIRDVLQETTYQRALPPIEAVLNGQRITYENVAYDTQGQPRTMRATYVPHLGENGQARAFLAMVEDITEQKQAEVALQRYVKRLRSLRAIDGVILAAQSPSDIGQAVSRRLQGVVPSDRVLVSSFDLENNRATVLASLADDQTWLEAGTQIEMAAFGSIDNLQKGKVSIVGDVQTSEETLTKQSGSPLEGARSYLHIPLVAQGKLIGSLLLISKNPATFTTEHIEVAGELSEQLAIGIHQASLHEQIQRHAEELEQQVTARTAELARRSAQLRVAAEVARDATTAHSLDVLLDNAVNLIRDRFEFYHASIFMTDERGEYAVLRSATGKTGRQMLEHGHSLKVGETGVVGYVCASGEPRITFDTGADASHFDNPFLPDTRSEMALPMRVGGRIIGALDVQSSKEAAFDDEDVSILQTLADQLAVAIERTHLFEQVQATLEKRLRTVISNAPVILFALDREGVFTLLEGRGLEALGLEPGEHVGMAIFDVYRDFPDVLDTARRVLAGETINSILDLKRAILETWSSPVRGADGEVTGVIGVAVDVTERHRMRERMQRQERLAVVGQLAGGIAHDFNNFLMTIIFYAHLLLRDKDVSPDVTPIVETIVGEANQAAALVRQVLDFSRRSVMETEPVDLSSFVEEVMDILQKTLPEDIRVVTEMGEDNYVVEIDPTRIQQVIMNLALNSRDAMPDGGNLRIELSRMTVESAKERPLSSDPELAAGDWVCLSVQDTGTGMDEHVRAHLFEPFFTTKGPKGNGLGLAQVYGIVKQHQGEIGVETEVGHGTTFRIYLPTYVRSHAQETETEEVTAIPEGRGEIILLVEDEDRVRHAGQQVLESLGYRVLTASNGREGLEVFQKAGEVDLVLTDMVMPEMGGRELIQTMKRIAPDVKALVITGYTIREDMQVLKDAGFADVVYKPLDVGVLGGTIRRILDAETENP
jgi:PAS domain S-box-containing protein